MKTNPEEDYARGYVPFLGINVRLDSRPLIPRTETEYWAEIAISEMPEDAPICVLDIFSGSGCIGLSVLKHRPNAFVTFTDIRSDHLETITKSIEENVLNPKHAFFMHADTWGDLNGRYEYVLANPPYISKERNTADKSVAISEPGEALFADEDGYEHIRSIVGGLPKFLASKGVCYIEHEPHHSKKMATQIEEMGFVSATKKDQYGVERYTRITRTPMA